MPYAIILSFRVCTSFVNSNLNSSLYVSQFTHYSGCCSYRHMRVENNVFFLHQYMQDRVLSMSQLKTAWPMHFLVGSHNTYLLSLVEKKYLGYWNFSNTLPQGGGFISRECSNLGTFWDIFWTYWAFWEFWTFWEVLWHFGHFGIFGSSHFYKYFCMLAY